MTEQELLKLCFYYKGEELVPPRFSKTDEGKLWQAEKIICEELQCLIEKENPKMSIAKAVAAYVSKWCPYDFGKIMDEYFSNAEDIREAVMLIYG